ncbi:MAG: L-threonylcarbamoyladenylate synthase [Actinomycetota bacterium]|nr:L-threonylcarbamoyladenylate synthase [Actinomycetota bacterium]
MSEVFSCSDEEERHRGLDAAEAVLRSGELVVMPTDTVYGVAADAFEPAAVRRLLRAKGRGADMPPPVLVAAVTTLDALATKLPTFAREMAEELWPGPLTLVCRQQPSLTWDLGDNRGTVAVRMPDSELVLELIQLTGPLAVSSANRTGMPAASSVAEAREMLGDAVSVYLDGGALPGALPSTILDVTGVVPRVLREGALDLARLRTFRDDIEVPASDA